MSNAKIIAMITDRYRSFQGEEKAALITAVADAFMSLDKKLVQLEQRVSDLEMLPWRRMEDKPKKEDGVPPATNA